MSEARVVSHTNPELTIHSSREIWVNLSYQRDVRSVGSERPGHPFVLDVERKTRLPAAEKFGSYAGQPGPGDGV